MAIARLFGFDRPPRAKLKEALESHRRMTFLTEASKVLMETPDYEAAFVSLARLMVPAVADYCVVYDLVDESRALRRVAHSHMNPEADRLLAESLEKTVSVSMGGPLAGALATGSSCIYDHFEELRTCIFQHERHEQALPGALKPVSSIVVPLQTRTGSRLGAIVAAMSGSGRRYAPTDRAFMEDLASRAAIVISSLRAYAEAIESNRLKDEFLATLSHELRTPLTAIAGYAQLLLGERLHEGSRRQAIESIHRNAQVQNQIISDLMDISRIVTGKLRLNVKQVDLKSVVEAALESARIGAEAKSHRLHFTCESPVGSVGGDPDRMQQVIGNLISNAIKFTSPGGKIEVQLRSAGPYAEIRVVDNGAGISPDSLPHVFDRFRQRAPAGARQNTGLGLGLAVVRHLVEMHGGTLQASSPGLGKGATFSVKFPLLQAAALKKAR